MKTTMTNFAAVTAAALVLPHAAGAQAPARSVAIGYADLDLASEAGRRALDLRIMRAIRAACGEASSADLRGQNEMRACRVALQAQVAAQQEAAFASIWRGTTAPRAAR